jgi:hypothetical protein
MHLKYIRNILQDRSRSTFFVLVVLAFILRLWALPQAELNPDGMLWTNRGINLVRQFSYGSELGHPGIVPAYLIGLSMMFFGSSIEGSLGILPTIIAARLPVVIFGSLTVGIIYLIGQRISGYYVGLVAGALLALDPIHIGTSRIIHLDVILTFFFTLSIYYILEYEEKSSMRNLVLLSIATALTVLSKKPGLAVYGITIVWVGYSKFSKYLMSEEIKSLKLKQSTKHLIIYICLSLLIVYIGYPRLWGNPIETIPGLFISASERVISGGGHEVGNYWMGEPTPAPPNSFYIIITLISLTEISVVLGLLGLAIVGYKLIHYPLEKRKIYLIPVWILSFLIPMSIAAKKLGARYILPLWPAYTLLAAIGFVAIFRILVFDNEISLNENHKSLLKHLGLVLLCMSLIFPVVSITPDYGSYNNEFIGGPSGGEEVWLKGGGYIESIDYIQDDGGENADILVLGNTNIPTYYYNGSFDNNGRVNAGSGYIAFANRDQWERKNQYDYLIIINSYIQRNPNHPVVIWGSEQKADHKAKIRGVTKAYVYKI